MTKQPDNQQKINKFFFGKMAEDERFAFENEFAADYELLEEMRAFEDDLIEKYVRGFMDSAEKSEFETHFLNTEKRRQKVEFSRQLINQLRQETKNETEKESVWSWFGKLFLTPKFASFGTAFALLVLIFGSWFLTRNLETEKTEIVKNENSGNTEISNKNVSINVETNVVKSNQNTQSNLETNLTKTPEKSPTPTKTPEPKKTPIETTAQNPVLALFAGTLRTDGEINELNLPKNAIGATFRLNLKTVDYKIFQAQVTDGNGKIIFRSGNLKPRKTAINLFVPAKNLSTGDYRIKLYGKNSAGENESAADFQFRVN